jgi:hypothetical protein
VAKRRQEKPFALLAETIATLPPTASLGPVHSFLPSESPLAGTRPSLFPGLLFDICSYRRIVKARRLSIRAEIG